MADGKFSFYFIVFAKKEGGGVLEFQFLIFIPCFQFHPKHILSFVFAEKYTL